MRSGIGRSASAICRSAVSMRCSSSPIRRGTPDTRMSFPPSWSMSLPSSVTSCVVDGGLHDAHDLVELGGERRVAVAFEDRVGAVEVQERDGRAAVLGVLAPVEEMPADRDRHEAGHVDRTGIGRDDRLDRAAGPAAIGGGNPHRAQDPRLRAGSSAAVDVAHHDLTRGRAALRVDGRRRVAARHEELAVRVTDREEVEHTRVHTDRDAQHDQARRRLQPADGAQAVPHPDRRVRGAGGVVVAREQQQQGVAAELQQAAARRVCNGQQLLEARIDRVGDLFGADLAVPGEPLRHLREARDVGEHHRAVDDTPLRCTRRHVLVGPRPLERQPRNIRNERPSFRHYCPSHHNRHDHSQ